MKKRISPFWTFICILLTLPVQLFTQTQIKSPSDFLEYQYGSKMPTLQEVRSYFHYLGRISEEVKVEPYGKSYEGRSLELVFLSSADNIVNLNSIREEHLKTVEKSFINRSGKPLILWLSHGVHGNEAGATAASPMTAYSILTEHRDLLNKAVIIIDPSLNPDGFVRYTQWYNQMVSYPPQSRREVIEHHEPWPTGRVNHYQFDLNRDWAWATQKETQARLQVYHQWMPQLHIDFHEQYPDNPYYFAPAADPIHPRITDFQRAIQDSIGMANARVFDAHKWLYFTEEYFDLFYPSYGDTYPIFNGAIGMTYEQAGHGIAGLSIQLKNGDTLRLQDRITHHRQAAITTLERCVELSSEINNAWNAYFKSARQNTGSNIESYILICESKRQRNRLKKLLNRHAIDTKYIPEGINVRGFSYKENDITSGRTNEYSLAINCNQPQSHLIHTLMEPENKLSKVITYDITAWAIPYMWGIEAIASKTSPTYTENYPSQGTDNQGRNSTDTNDVLAWTLKYKTADDIYEIAQLLDKGLKIRKFKVADNDPLFILLASENEGINVEILSDNWEKITDGRALNYDLGSDKFTLLEKPTVLLPTSTKMDAYSYGFIWHFMEREMQYPIYRIDLNKIEDILPDYNTVVFPAGDYSLDSQSTKALDSWIKNGGNAIFIGNAVSIVSSQEYGIHKKQMKSAEDTTITSYLKQNRIDTSRHNPGAIIRIKWDNEAPMGWGMDEALDCLILGNSAYKFLEGGVQVGYIDKWRMDRGFIGHKVKDNLMHSMRFSYKKVGKGKVSYMIDDPLFRGFWEAGKQLFANAIILM